MLIAGIIDLFVIHFILYK